MCVCVCVCVCVRACVCDDGRRHLLTTFAFFLSFLVAMGQLIRLEKFQDLVQSCSMGLMIPD